jgi:hypothetical protein
MGVTRRGHIPALAVLAVTVAFAVFAAPASAATTRAEYVAQVDPICQAGIAQETAVARPLTKKLHRLKKHARSREARRRADKRATRALARFYDFVAVVEQGVTAQIATTPPPTEDTSLIQVWLRVRGEEVVVTQRLFRSFAKGDFFGAFDLLFEVVAKSEEASDLVRDFGFHYCSSPAQQVVF